MDDEFKKTKIIGLNDFFSSKFNSIESNIKTPLLTTQKKTKMIGLDDFFF